MTGAPRLLEREHELARVGELVRPADAGDGRMLMIDGEAGTGKSVLMDVACEVASAAGLVVLRARGGVLERDFGFGVVRQLFEPALAGVSKKRRTELFSGAAELAAPVFGLAAPAAETVDAALAAQHGLYWLTANLAGSARLLISVDDAHWADRASLRWLLYLARRLEGLPVGVIAATRIGEPEAAEPELQALRLERLVELISLGPLTSGGSDVLIGDAFEDEPDAAFSAACHTVTGGNPFFLRELVSAVSEEGLAPNAESTDVIERLGRDRASGQILLRVSRLGSEASAVAGAVAVLGASATSRRAGLLAGLDAEACRSAIDALADGRVLAPGDPVDFVHPLVRAAVYEDLPAAQRAAMHLRAARLLHEDAANDEAAVHLLSAERTGDRWVVESLLDAGRRDRDRGGGDSAARLLRRALEEPPPADLRGVVLLELGRAERITADPAAAGHLQEARALAGGAEEIERTSHELAYLLGVGGDIEAGAAVLEAAVEEVRDIDGAAALRLEIDLVSLLVNHDATFARGSERLERVLPTVAADTPVQRALRALETWTRFESGRETVAEMEAVALGALSGTTLMDELGPDALPLQAGILGLTRCDRLDLTSPLLDRVLDESRRRGSVFGIAAAHVMRCQDAYWSGDVRRLEQESEAAVEFSLLAEAPFVFAGGLTCLVVARVHQGRLDEAEQLLELYGLSALDPPRFVLARLVLLARSRLRIAQGRHDEAVADTLEALERDRGRHACALPLYSLPELAPALHAAGDRDRALAIAGEYVAAATQWGSRCELGRATRIIGVIEGSARGLELLRQSVELLEPTGRRLEYALALIDLGAAMRRSGERAAAREPLRSGMELAHRCGADVEAERARTELGAAGARPRALVRTGVEALTAAERRVAELAAGGRNNPAIAQALYLSRRTVEAHLRSIFRKLDIHSREHLAVALEIWPR